MPTLKIQRGATAIGTWDVNTNTASFHPSAIHRDGTLVVEESEKFTFVFDPVQQGTEYRIFIGDVPLSDLALTLDDAGGVVIAGQLFWRELAYFESARGQTRVVLESQPEGSVHDTWKVVLSIETYVLPSKLGEERYLRMVGDLGAVSRSLLVDLYGKSNQTHDVRLAKECRTDQSREQELASILASLERLARLLDAIGKRPASRVRTKSYLQAYWGGERLVPAAIIAMGRRGTALRVGELPVLIPSRRVVESFDIPEHRVTRAFLDILGRRATYCAEVARAHIQAIMSERQLRDVRLRIEPTLFESVDLPRVRRLTDAVRQAARAVAMANTLSKLPFLQEARAELAAVRGGVFQRNPEYRALLSVIRQFLIGHAVWYQGDEISAVTKLTSRLFEQWCYLRIVDAFRKCGLQLREWTDALRENLRSRFILDFDRGLTFEGLLTGDLRLRIRYEPWILGRESAVRAGETLCRGSSTDVPWCPDIFIECLTGEGATLRPIWGIVLDCKYTSKIRSQHWTDTSKYLEVRCTRTRRQIVRQLWLVAPSDQPGIQSEDPAVHFDDNGPSCDRDETVRFRLMVTPGTRDGENRANVHENDPFEQFARGTIKFLRRTLGVSGVSPVKIIDSNSPSSGNLPAIQES